MERTGGKHHFKGIGPLNAWSWGVSTAQILPHILAKQVDAHTHTVSPRGYSLGPLGPEGSSHTVGSVCSQAAQFTSSTLRTRAALSLWKPVVKKKGPSSRGVDRADIPERYWATHCPR